MRARTASTALSALVIIACFVASGMARGQPANTPPAVNALPVANTLPPANTLSVSIDNKSIGGVVTSRFGPEAGVWVIAETRDLGTRFAKMVVTDERGRYVIPDLPKAH